MKLPTILPVTLLLLLSQPSQVVARRGNGTLGTFSWSTTKNVFAFGDSYSSSHWDVEQGLLSADTGETSANGPNWIQYLSRTYNDSNIMMRSLAAHGASIDNDLVQISDHETGVRQQVDKFEKYLFPPPAEIPWKSTNTLFTIWVGINDCDLTFERPGQHEWHTTEFRVWRIQMERLYSFGARHFLVMTIPPIYAAPLFQGRGDLKAAVMDYNTILRRNAVAFQKDHEDAVVLWYDAHETFAMLIDNAPRLGFKNWRDVCYAYTSGTPTGTTYYPECEYPVQQYFWKDWLHPSSPVHKLLALKIKHFLSSPSWIEKYREEKVYLLDTGAQGMKRGLLPKDEAKKRHVRTF
ncbi:hypothetical protein T439DRAFT_323896 [Meredithblackwellia eburnea MCA 4105]